MNTYYTVGKMSSNYRQIINTLIISFIAIIFSLTSASVYASNQSKTNIDESDELYSVRYSTIDDALDNYNNKLILSVFGKTGLIGFLGDSATDVTIRDINSLTAEEVKNYAKPFPSSISYVVTTITYSLYVLVSMYFGSLMFRYVIERIFMSQESKSTDTAVGAPFYMMLVRSFVGFFIAVPVAGALAVKVSGKENQQIYSMLHMFMFESFGLAFRAADDISMHFNDTKDIYSPVYPIPSGTIYKNEFGKLIDFGMCVQTTELANKNIKEHIFEVVSERNIVSFRGFVQNCSINVGFEIDSELQARLDSLGFDDLSSYEFTKIQLDGFKRHLANIVNDALHYTYTAAKTLKSKREIKKGSSLRIDITNWSDSCSLPPEDRAKNISSWQEYVSDREIYSLCLSKRHVEYLAYPINSKDIDKIISENRSRLSGRLKETCAPIDGKVDDVLNNTGYDYLKQCVLDSCKKVDVFSSRSGLFECSVAAASMEKMVEAKEYTQKGFLVNSVRHFTDIVQEQLPDSAKTPLNSLSLLFEVTTNISTKGDFLEGVESVPSMPNPIFNKDSLTVSVPHVGSNIGSSAIKRFSKSWKSSRLYSSEEVTSPSNGIRVEYIGAIENESSKVINPFSRAVICMKNANQLTEHGMCGSVIIELTKLGAFSSGAFLAMFLGEKANRILVSAERKTGGARKKRGDGDASISGDSSNKKTTPENSLKAMEFLTKSSRYIGSAALIGLGGMGLLDNSVDHYGGVEDDNMSYLYGITGIAMLLSHKTPSSGNGSIGSVFVSTIQGVLMYTILVSFVIIPLLPLYFLFIGVVTAIAAMISLFIACQFILISILANADEIDPTSRIKKAVSRFIVAFIRIPLVVMGFYVAIHMIDVIVPSVITLIEDTMFLKFKSDISSVVGIELFLSVFTFVVTLLFILLIVYSCIDIVKQLYSVSRTLLMGEDSESDSGTTVDATKAIQDKAKIAIAKGG